MRSRVEMRRVLAGCVTVALVLVLGLAQATDPEPGLLRSFVGNGGTPAAPWRVIGLPKQTKPFTRFSITDLDGHKALRVEADSSYGNLVHPLHVEHPGGHLAWQWRVDELNNAVDLHTRAGDDTALKVCVLWDMPIDLVPFVERAALRFLRTRSDEPLPAATVCYVWDAHLPAGTRLDSAFTRRLRYIVLRSGAERLHRWTPERRDIGADFLKLFGNETRELPPLIGIAIGADADNTHGHSLAHAADLVLGP